MSTPAMTEPAAKDAIEEIPAAESAGKPLITLWAKSAKGAETMRVYGRSGKRYTFTKHQATRRLVRDYFSREQFEREEADMRGLRQNQPHELLTMLGEADPVVGAIEAVKALEGATRRIPVNVREATLREVAALCFAAVERIQRTRETSQQEDAEAERQAAASEQPEPTPAKEPELDRPDNWQDPEGEIVTATTERVIEPIDGPLVTKPADTSPAKRWEQAELMQLPWNDFKAMATRDGVAVGKLGKEKLAEAYLAAQAAGFPNRGTQA